MRAGRLKHKISIITPGATTRSGDGAPIVTYSTILSCWADAQPMIGNEVFRDDYRWSNSDLKFTIRYSTVEILPKMSVICTGSTYNILSVVDSSNAHKELILLTYKTT